jgi:hypothetical protein
MPAIMLSCLIFMDANTHDPVATDEVKAASICQLV